LYRDRGRITVPVDENEKQQTVLFFVAKECITILLLPSIVKKNNAVGKITMVWKPGQSGNIGGRPRKYPRPPEDMSRQHSYEFFKTAALRDEYRAVAEAQDLEDPVLFQHRMLTDESIPKSHRAVIANQIAPYYRPRLGIMEPAKYVQTPIEVPEFADIEQAEAFLLQLAQRVAAQELDLDSVAAVSARVLDWVHSKRAGLELQIKQINASQDTGEQVIRIEGGMPPLPGSDVIMPNLELNGHQLELTAVANPQASAADPVASPQEESEP
jgi:hypothetical protein